MKIASHVVTVDIVADIVSYYGYHPRASLEDVERYVARSKSCVRSGIQTAAMLGIIQCDKAQCLVETAVVDDLGVAPTAQRKLDVMRKYIQKWPPMVTFIQLCLSGCSVTDATRKTYALHRFEGEKLTVFRSMLISWGQRLGLFSIDRNQEEITLAADVDEARHEFGPMRLDSDIAARLMIAEILGPDAHAFLMDDETEELVRACRAANSDPRGAMECAGRAFEDVLRRLALIVKVDVSKANGISQVASSLYNNKLEGTLDNKIHSKHLDICVALGSIRNMAGHSKEARTMERWTLGPHAAVAHLRMVLCAIRSLHAYIVAGEQLFL
ncbi:MAG: hypothetical protein KGZ53_03840 [Peptococcaceae bacterium]|nr:hypothetical protein [Peptococcaceae bacterium]